MAKKGAPAGSSGGGLEPARRATAGDGRYFAVTLDVIEAMTIDAILNSASRLVMPCRCAI
jgi:hypothetical protein